jgi:hypothetical protein
MFHNLFISVRRSTCDLETSRMRRPWPALGRSATKKKKRSTCFRRFFRPSSGAQNCTYSVRCLSDQYVMLYFQFWAIDDERKSRLKHVERLTEINKPWNVAGCWLNCMNMLQQYIHIHLIVSTVICVIIRIRMFITLLTTACHWVPVMSLINPVRIFMPYFVELPYTCNSAQVSQVVLQSKFSP